MKRETNIGANDALAHAHSILQADPSAKVILYLHSCLSADSGKPWCPDCVTADPVVSCILADYEHHNFHLVDISLERPFYKDHAAFMPRKDATLHTEAIPIMIHVASTEKKGAESRLIEKDLCDEKMIREWFDTVLGLCP